MERESLTGVRLGCDLVGFDGDVRGLLLALRSALRSSLEVAEVEVSPPDEDVPTFVVELHFDRPLGTLEDPLLVSSTAEAVGLVQGAATSLRTTPDSSWELRVRSVEVSPVGPCPSGVRLPVGPWRMVSAEPLDAAESEVALGLLPDMSPLQMAAGALAFAADKEARAWPEDRVGHWRRIYQSRFLWRAEDPTGETAALAELLATLLADAGERPTPSAFVRYVERSGGTAALRAVLARR